MNAALPRGRKRQNLSRRVRDATMNGLSSTELHAWDHQFQIAVMIASWNFVDADEYG